MKLPLALVTTLLLVSSAPGRAQEAIVANPAPSPSPSATPAPPPQIEFPGQYAATPDALLRFPPAMTGCRRFAGDERIACLESLGADYGRLARYAQANAALPPRKRGERRVVFFGDSITDNWSKAGYGGFFPGQPYVNRGIGSHTTSQMLVRFRADVLDLDPDVVVFLAGTNDIAGNTGPISDESIERNFMSMAELAKAHGVRVVLGSVLPVSDDKKDAEGQPLVRTEQRPTARIRAMNAWLAEYARRHGHVYLDYYSAMAGPSGALKSELNADGLHPSAAGYAVMAPLAEQAIASALRSRP